MKIKATALVALGLSLFVAADLTAASARPAPKPIETPSPVYPEVLADTGTAGKAVIEVLVKADGTVGETKVKSADHEAFATAATTVLPLWRFEPAMKDGTPIDTRVSIPFHFIPPLPQQINAVFKRKVYQSLPQAALTQKEFGKKLKPVKSIRPVYPKALAKSDVEESVAVKFVIAPDGSTVNPEITNRPRKEFILPALAAIATATFPPPVKDGQPVYVETTHTVKFAPPQQARRGGRGGGGGGGGGGGDFGGGGGDFGGGGGID